MFQTGVIVLLFGGCDPNPHKKDDFKVMLFVSGALEYAIAYVLCVACKTNSRVGEYVNTFLWFLVLCDYYFVIRPKREARIQNNAGRSGYVSA